MAAGVSALTDEMLPAGPEVPLGTFFGHFQLILIDLSAQLAVCLPFLSSLLREESNLSMNKVCSVGESFAFQFFFCLCLSERLQITREKNNMCQLYMIFCRRFWKYLIVIFLAPGFCELEVGKMMSFANS